MEGPPRAPLLTHVAALLAVTIWAGGFIVTRAVARSAAPTLVGLLRAPLAALPMAAGLRLAGAALPGSRRDRGLLLLAALGGFVLFPLLSTWGMALTTAGRAGFIVGSAPAFTALAGSVLAGERLGRQGWIGAALALAGLAWLIAARTGGGLTPDVTGGDLLVLLSTLAAACSYVGGALLARRGPGSSPPGPWAWRRRCCCPPCPGPWSGPPPSAPPPGRGCSSWDGAPPALPMCSGTGPWPAATSAASAPGSSSSPSSSPPAPSCFWVSAPPAGWRPPPSSSSASPWCSAADWPLTGAGSTPTMT